MTDRPLERPWHQIVDPEVSYLSEDELDDFPNTWRAERCEYQTNGERFSAWWVGKIVDRGLRERSRRRYRAQPAQPPPAPGTNRTTNATRLGGTTDDQH